MEDDVRMLVDDEAGCSDDESDDGDVSTQRMLGCVSEGDDDNDFMEDVAGPPFPYDEGEDGREASGDEEEYGPREGSEGRRRVRLAEDLFPHRTQEELEAQAQDNLFTRLLGRSVPRPVRDEGMEGGTPPLKRSRSALRPRPRPSPRRAEDVTFSPRIPADPAYRRALLEGFVPLYERKRAEDHAAAEAFEKIWKSNELRKASQSDYVKSDRVPWTLHNFIPTGMDPGLVDTRRIREWDPEQARTSGG